MEQLKVTVVPKLEVGGMDGGKKDTAFCVQ